MSRFIKKIFAKVKKLIKRTNQDSTPHQHQQQPVSSQPIDETILEQPLRETDVRQDGEYNGEPQNDDAQQFRDHFPPSDPSKPPISTFFRSESYGLDPKNLKTESGALAERTFQYFYCGRTHQFQGKVEHEAADCLSPQRVNQVALVQQEYWNKDYHAFCAWKMFIGNKDIYYDDNAHAVQALISSYEVTGQLEFLLQAKDVLEYFIMKFATEEAGGIPWHVSNNKVRAACSVGPAVISALRIRALPSTHVLDSQNRPEYYLRFATIMLTWLREIERTKWSYNSGFAIHGFTLLYEATNDRSHLKTAIEIAEAALDPNGVLYDHCIPDPSQRMLSDGSFFLHHLVDGYLALSKHAHTKKLRNEIIRIAKWGKEFMKDKEDELYYRGSRPYTISSKQANQFYVKFGIRKFKEQNKQELDKDGNQCKTMIGCASWARILRAAEIVKASIAKESAGEATVNEKAIKGMKETTDAVHV
ncbi:glycosyl hydrolase [Botrytis cinerea]